MKIPGVLIYLLYWTVSFGQTKPETITITFSTFNHAERLFNGTTTYYLTASVIKVKKTYFGDTTCHTIYTRKIRNSYSLISALSKIEMDTLKEHYSNLCILPTSGDEYFLNFVFNSTKKRIDLHHYYLKQLDDIIQLINLNLPRRYRFNYLPKDIKQDCETFNPVLKKSI